MIHTMTQTNVQTNFSKIQGNILMEKVKWIHHVKLC
jgi:hypothetical protein